MLLNGERYLDLLQCEIQFDMILIDKDKSKSKEI